jgi:hypothetical protein
VEAVRQQEGCETAIAEVRQAGSWMETRALLAVPLVLSVAHAALASDTSTKRSSIRDIPWKDRAYDFGDGESCKFSGGSYSKLDDEGSCLVCMQILDVTFGDVDRDGQEEALVLVSTNLGEAGTSIDGYVFGLDNGLPVLRAAIEGGDRGEGESSP